MNYDLKMLIRWSKICFALAALHVIGGIYSATAALIGLEPSSHELGMPVVALGIVYILAGRWGLREAVHLRTPRKAA